MPLISSFFACNALLAYLVLSGSDWVRRFLGKNGASALSRTTALLTASLAVAFVVGGTTDIVAAMKLP